MYKSTLGEGDIFSDLRNTDQLSMLESEKEKYKKE